MISTISGLNQLLIKYRREKLMLEFHTRANKTYFVSETYDTDLTTVLIVHLPTGITAKGHAKRHSTDIYNASVGQKLAYFRAMERLSHKITKTIIKSLGE